MAEPCSEIATRERCEILRRFGADEGTLTELLAYTENPYVGRLDPEEVELPLAEEPHVAVWREYEREARRIGAAAELRRRLVQLAFPIAEGLSGRAEYRAATLRGEWPTPAAGPELSDPAGVRIVIHDGAGGPVPVIEIADRRDFVSLVRALTGRNEPIAVPDSMGACLVKGLINQDRLARHRRAWEQRQGAALEEADAEGWRQELRRLAPHKELYQDRLLLLSRGPYSALPAREMGLDEESWRQRSAALRGEHECFHYLTLRLFGTIRSNLLDELLADFAGSLVALGGYRQQDGLRFLGIVPGEETPRLAATARLRLYLGDPPLGDEALAVLLRLAVAITGRLEALAYRGRGEIERLPRRARVLLELATRPLEQLAVLDEAVLLRRIGVEEASA